MAQDIKIFFSTLIIAGAIVLLIWCRSSASVRSAVVDFFSPFLVEKKAIEKKIDHSSFFKKSKIELFRENEKLLEELEALRIKQAKLSGITYENKELRHLFTLPARENYTYKIAQIITRDPASGGRRVRIDQGTVDGVMTGQPVLVNGHFYGRILETSDHSALVVTIVDPNCKISAKIAGTNIHGIFHGQLTEQWKIKPLCILDFLPRDPIYKPGMKIVTSEMGLTIPGGIPIGTLVPYSESKIVNTIDQLYNVALIKPLDLSQTINFVLIMIKNSDSSGG